MSILKGGKKQEKEEIDECLWGGAGENGGKTNIRLCFFY
jgi:hypothetical protein